MQAFEHMQDLIASLGARVISDEPHWQDSSSQVSFYEKNSRKVRLVWDGKDNCGFAQVVPETTGPRSIPVVRFSDRDFATNPEAARRMLRLNLSKLFGCEA
jgi:hypothetical protein